jgi:hypothetical protein
MIAKIAVTSFAAIATSLGLVTLQAPHASVVVSNDVQVYCGTDTLCPSGLYVGE